MSDWPISYLRCQRGASCLLELCIVSACLGLVAFWLMPGLQGVSSRYQKAQFMECLKQAIQLAKNEALAKRSTVMLCGSSDGVTCTPQENWGPYWLVGEAGHTPSSSRMRFKKALRVYRISSPNQLTFKAFKDRTIEACHPLKMSYYLVIRPNGQTYNNGTFTYTYLENGKRKHTRLKVNKLLRTYEDSEK